MTGRRAPRSPDFESSRPPGVTPAGRTSLGPEHRGERGGVKQWKRKSANLRRLALAIICNVAPTGFEPALPP
ncbi:hypothetical protein FRAHR75_70118 [Frankia sp. Hr75.2]|nr:hypothetical protein FRAHR75_70118 [Frankia sp. Hr75.2]